MVRVNVIVMVTTTVVTGVVTVVDTTTVVNMEVTVITITAIHSGSQKTAKDTPPGQCSLYTALAFVMALCNAAALTALAPLVDSWKCQYRGYSEFPNSF
jgi:hypothetical protein